MQMDTQEAKLLAEIRARRADLVMKAEGLKRTLTETFDPRERIKRHPLRGILSSVGAGMFLGRMMTGRASRRTGVEPEPAPPEPQSPLAALAAGVLPTLLPTLLPAVMGPLMSLIMPRGSRRRAKTNSH